MRWMVATAVLLCGCHASALNGAGPGAADAAVAVDLATGAPSPADLGDACTIEVRFAPAASGMQIAVWVEDAGGAVRDTLYLTNATGLHGLGNRPGEALLETDCGWCYGRREMVLPIWAHRRNHLYPKIVMGGVCGNSPQGLCPDGTPCAGDCDESTVVYHSRVESADGYYCRPFEGAICEPVAGCHGFVSKGAYRPFPDEFSLYPPRADLTAMDAHDGPDVLDFARRNDVAVVSQATPAGRKPGEAPLAIAWRPTTLPPGDYVAWVELSQESDFNASHDHPSVPDSEPAWQFLGHDFLGQPSIAYAVPFRSGPGDARAETGRYRGYGAWDGSDGALRPPDATISDTPGTGAGRLLDVVDGAATYRVRVTRVGCGG